MPNPEKRTELLVGLFLFIGLVLLGGLILQFGRFQEHFGNRYEIIVVFDDASGLIKGSEVRMGGARIGQVARLPELTEAVQVEVAIAVTESIRIPTGSAFQINSATLLGDKLIVVIPPAEKTGEFIKPGSRIRGGGPTGLEALQNQAEIVSRDVIRLLKSAETTMVKIDGAVAEIQNASKQLGEAGGKINRSILAEDNLARFDSTLANLADVTRQWKETSAKLEPTLADARDALASVKSAANTTEETLAQLKPAIKGVPAAVDNISNTAIKAGDALDRMAHGEGLLGALATDNEITLDAKAFVRNLRQYGILLYRNEDPQPKETPKLRLGPVHR